jgi:hypothetical protein
MSEQSRQNCFQQLENGHAAMAERKRGGKKGRSCVLFEQIVFHCLLCISASWRILFTFHSFSSIVSHLFFVYESHKKMQKTFYEELVLAYEQRASNKKVVIA